MRSVPETLRKSAVGARENYKPNARYTSFLKHGTSGLENKRFRFRYTRWRRASQLKTRGQLHLPSRKVLPVRRSAFTETSYYPFQKSTKVQQLNCISLPPIETSSIAGTQIILRLRV